MTALRILSVDMIGRTVMCSTGQSLPITDLFDIDRRATNEPGECAHFVAGASDLWFSCAMESFDWPTIH